jgi:hypothetical protein
MQVGSLINHLAVNSKHLFNMPVIGTGVTFYSWSDRSAGTVVGIFDLSKKIIEIKHDTATRIDNNGMSDCQNYSYEMDINSRSVFYRWSSKKSQWQGVEKNEKGRWVLSRGQSISVGNRDAHYDYSF